MDIMNNPLGVNVMTELTYLTFENFEEKVKNNKYNVVLSFTSSWCSICRQAEEIIIKKFSKIDFYQINIDESEDLAVQNKVIGIPSVIVFRNGEEIIHLTGIHDIHQLEQRLPSLPEHYHDNETTETA